MSASHAPLSAYDRAARLAVLAGGADILYLRARSALHDEPRWTAALADHLLTLEPERLDYRLLKDDALKMIGGKVLAGDWGDCACRENGASRPGETPFSLSSE